VATAAAKRPAAGSAGLAVAFDSSVFLCVLCVLCG